MRLARPVVAAILVLLAAFATSTAPSVSAVESWTITSFDALYNIRSDGVVEVTEDIQVDFGTLQKHGIFRDIPVEYAYDPDHTRSTPIKVRGVDDGSKSWRYETSRSGANLRIKIGDPDREVSGRQRYRIRYEISGALNAFDDHDELYWNSTGHEWEAPIESSSATVQAPEPGINRVACFQGRRNSTTPCASQLVGGEARFSTGMLPVGHGLTVVVALPKGLVDVPPPRLIEQKDAGELVADFLGLSPLPIALAGVVLVLVAAAVFRLWWLNGRDHWFGDAYYLNPAASERSRPLFARDTIVPEFAPPPAPKSRRPLRPAEIGLLMDERADTLDVSATIVDLAVRGYMRIEETARRKYTFHRLKEADEELLPYERALLGALFQSGEVVEMRDLQDSFYDDLALVKEGLYDQGVRADNFFPRNPNSVRTTYVLLGLVFAGLGVGAAVLAGQAGFGIVPAPLVLGGLAVSMLSPAMPRRTGAGRELYRRGLGFREFMVTAGADHARFQEEENIFDKYLPYAIVFGCTDKWARTFQGLEGRPGTTAGTMPYWYVGTAPFVITDFADNIERFSSSVSSVMTSTPSSSGSSGFSTGGGFSGGGGGGGGGGSW